MTRPRLAVSASLAGLVLLGFFLFPGHAWLQQDTQIWLPMLERIWDPTALQHDLIASKPHLSYTLFDEITIALRWSTHSSFHAALVVEQIAMRFLELLGIYLLARAFGLTARMAVLVASCFGLGATIVGPAVLTFEYEPVPRGFALGFLCLAMGLAARKRLMEAGFAVTLGFLLHAPTAVPVILLLMVIAFRRRDYRPLIPLGCAFVLLLIVAQFQVAATESQLFFGTIDPAWERIERFRASYNWVSVWVNPLMWQYVFFGAAAMIAVWRIKPPCGRLFAIGLPAIGLLSVPVSYILTERVKWTIMPEVQPARAVLWVTAMAVITGAAAGVRAAERRIWYEAVLWFALVFSIPMSGRIAGLPLENAALAFALAALATLGVSAKRRYAAAVLALAIVVPYFAIPRIGHVQNYPHLKTPELEQLSTYASASTPKDAMFLFPDAGRELYPGWFRAVAVRAVYVDWKAGGQVNYFRSLAQDWWTRWQATMSDKNVATDWELLQRLGIDYIVMKKKNAIAGLPPVYSNAGYVVYRVAGR